MTDTLRIRVYCMCHRAATRLLGRRVEPDLGFSYRYEKPSPDAWYGENETGFSRAEAPVAGRHKDSDEAFTVADEAWADLVSRSVVPDGWANSGLCNVCYDRAVGQWCLSSWIWTSAAIARYAASCGNLPMLLRIADEFLSRQHGTGGWIVRNDYDRGLPAPMLAPNDSCYIAENALLPAFAATSDERYLDSAKACADWVMKTALPSGLVSTGLNVATGKWNNSAIIVDTGFTAALFADLAEITGESAYLGFLRSFSDAYSSAFRDPTTGGFATSVDGMCHRSAGRFSRGQAWALEGLMPAYDMLGDEGIKATVDGIAGYLVAQQSSDGGWAYDFSKPLLGQDCKGVSVIARSLASWGLRTGRKDCLESAGKALEWCRAHTELEGECPGGIFSYCMEGAVTHYFYTEAAFVYSSVYALEATALLAREQRERGNE